MAVDHAAVCSRATECCKNEGLWRRSAYWLAALIYRLATGFRGHFPHFDKRLDISLDTQRITTKSGG